MASLLNSVKDSSLNFTTGAWEDVKDYTSVIITLKSAIDGSGTIEWADTSGRRFPTSGDVVAREPFVYKDISGQPLTIQRDHRARWFRVLYDHSGAENVDYNSTTFRDVSFNLQTLYKKAATELKIVDDSANIVSVNVGVSGNSLYTLLTDASGVPIRTTNPTTTVGEALYVHLADASGVSLATTKTGAPESLFVALHDASNRALDSTGTTTNALFVRPGDASGNAQASTFSVYGAASPGVALYAALADNCGQQIDTTARKNYQPATTSNALFVHLTDSQGRSIDSNNALPVINTVETTGALAFDVSRGIIQDFISPDPSMATAEGKKINLYNIFAYNDSPTTVWLKVYDTSLEKLAALSLDTSVGLIEDDFKTKVNANAVLLPRYNIPVPGGRNRDIVLPGGATFNYGVFFRATTQYRNTSIQGPGANQLFLNGSYTKDSA